MQNEMMRNQNQAVHRRNLLMAIQETEFVCLELNLYLDVNPDDEKALKEFNSCSKKLRELKELYDCEVGPLQNFGYSPFNASWVYATPWPWEHQ